MEKKLNMEVLLPQTRNVFEICAKDERFSQFNLIGGTALSLQLGHRISLDLDFTIYQDKLPSFKILEIIQNLKNNGHQVRNIIDTEVASNFRINYGKKFSDYVQNYIIDDVKVEFVANNKNPKLNQFYNESEKIKNPGISFSILDVETLKVAKTLVIADRVKSRDLYDVKVLMDKHNLTIDEMRQNWIKFAPDNTNDPEYLKSVMIGTIPLDGNDEGLDPVLVEEGMDSIYSFFKQKWNEYEIVLTQQILQDDISLK